MKKTTEPETVVIFREDMRGEVVAFFPERPGTSDRWTCSAYVHMGQHCAAVKDYYRRTKPAKDYADLYHELTRIIGYRLKVVKRWTRDHDRARFNNYNTI